MNNEALDQRLAVLEQRQAKLELMFKEFILSQRHSTSVTTSGSSASSSASSAIAATNALPSHQPHTTNPSARPASPTQPVSELKFGNVLGWGGAFAFLLAAVYMIRLALDSGWLTPLIQVTSVAVFGLILIFSGCLFRKDNRNYAGLLPAAGIAILFLAIYGGHLYYQLIGPTEAVVAVGAVCVASLLLCKLFNSDLYAFFAVAGSYSAPFFLNNQNGTLDDLIVYFTGWGIVFCAFALWQGVRQIYLLALYLSLIGFDFVWQQKTSGQWVGALFFQLAQFVLFAATTAWFSVKQKKPLETEMALAHFPPLLLFYVLQFGLLKQHVPDWAPWISMLSLVLTVAVYLTAQGLLHQKSRGGELLVWAYGGLVLFHTGFLALTSAPWQPWLALLTVPVAVAVSIREEHGVKGLLGCRWPIWVAVGLMYAISYLQIVFDVNTTIIPAKPLLSILNALLLYSGYWFCRNRENIKQIGNVLLGMAHVCAMMVTIHLIHQGLIASVVWSGLAIATMIWSLRTTDRLLRNSSLAIFGATAFKVMLFDLSGADSSTRILGLIVLGIAFYAGGLIFQKLAGGAFGATTTQE